MANESPLQLIWRRKWIVIVTFLVFTTAVAAISKSLPKVYSTSSTLLIAQPDRSNSFDSVQAAESVARSYADILSSSNFAERVSRRVGGGLTRDQLSAKVSVEPVPETQLLKIEAEDGSAARSKQIADTYAQDFIEYADASLSETTKSQVSLADAAPLPGSPARPKPTLYTLLGAILGLALGLGFAFASTLFDRRVRSPEELAEMLEVPVLASLLLARNERSRKLNEEAYRVLRTNLEFVRPDKPLNTITVVSPSEGEGKTSTVLNLGRAIAEVGDEVILVEGDMRRPALQSALLPDASEPLRPGLSNYLSGAAELEDVIHATENPRIRLLPAGPVPPAASTLLDTERGQRLLKRLSDRANIVVVDSPPLSVGADASLLSSGADETLMVIDTRRSTVKAIRAAIQQLQLVKAPLAGVILNRVKSTGDEASYGYYMAPDESRKGSRRRSARRARQAGSGPVRASAPVEDALPRETLGDDQDLSSMNDGGGFEPAPKTDPEKRRRRAGSGRN